MASGGSEYKVLDVHEAGDQKQYTVQEVEKLSMADQQFVRQMIMLAAETRGKVEAIHKIDSENKDINLAEQLKFIRETAKHSLLIHRQGIDSFKAMAKGKNIEDGIKVVLNAIKAPHLFVLWAALNIKHFPENFGKDFFTECLRDFTLGNTSLGLLIGEEVVTIGIAGYDINLKYKKGELTKESALTKDLPSIFSPLLAVIGLAGLILKNVEKMDKSSLMPQWCFAISFAISALSKAYDIISKYRAGKYKGDELGQDITAFVLSAAQSVAVQTGLGIFATYFAGISVGEVASGLGAAIAVEKLVNWLSSFAIESVSGDQIQQQFNAKQIKDIELFMKLHYATDQDIEKPEFIGELLKIISQSPLSSSVSSMFSARDRSAAVVAKPGAGHVPSSPEIPLSRSLNSRS